jgi:hypothetical protein
MLTRRDLEHRTLIVRFNYLCGCFLQLEKHVDMGGIWFVLWQIIITLVT